MSSVHIHPWRQPVNASVSVPGSKSYTNRGLLMAALTPGPVRIINPLLSDDTTAMTNCLESLGILFESNGDDVIVLSDVSGIKNRSYELHAGLSGITIRFLLALSCVVPGTQTLTGHEGLLKRPIGELVDGLRQLGAKIEYLGQEGYPPVRVHSAKLQPGTTVMDGGVSSQYFSALLMIAPLVEGGLTIQVKGKQISAPYIDMTIDTLKHFGITATNNQYRSYTVPAGQTYRAQTYHVEGDVSSASYFFAMAALNQSTITVTNLNPSSAQADMRLLDILERMGSTVIKHKDSITVEGHGVRPLDIDMEACPDQAMTIAVLAAFAKGTTTLHGVQSLRIKETERVVALEQELAKLGIETHSTHDTLTIHGGQPHAASIATYGDHRIAMAFAVAGTHVPGIVIEHPEVVNKTFPDFWKKLAHLTPPKKDAPNIILIGMRGSGKTTLGRLLAKHLGHDFVDMDERIVANTGLSVPQLVEQRGWEGFRDEESAVVEELASRHGTVIAAGGGVVLRPQNIDILKRSGRMVLLKSSPQTSAERIKNDTNRPKLTAEDDLLTELRLVWEERRAKYTAAADTIISTDDISPEQALEAILRYLEQKS